MSDVLIPNTEQKAIYDALVAAAAPWNGAKVHLFKAPVAIVPTMLISDFTAVECDFTGYVASAAVTWTAAFYQPSGVPCQTGDVKTFTVGSPAVTLNTVYGYWLANGAGTALLWARSFTTPIVLSAAGQVVEVLPSIPNYILP